MSEPDANVARLIEQALAETDPARRPALSLETLRAEVAESTQALYAANDAEHAAKLAYLAATHASAAALKRAQGARYALLLYYGMPS